MKVLLVTQEYPSETAWGGIGTYAGIIAPALAKRGCKVHVLSCVRGQESSDRVVRGVVVHRRPSWRPRGVGRLSRLPDTWERLVLAAATARELRRLGETFDVVECPEWMAEGLAIAVGRSVPMVVRLHSGASQVFPYLGPLGVDRRLAIRLEHAAVRRADIVTGTRAQIDGVARRLGLDEPWLREITYPVRPAPIRPIPKGDPTVLFAGRFERRKGADTLIRAAAVVLARVPGARFRFVGRDTTGPGIPSYADWLRKLAAECGVGHAVEIVERWGSDVVARELDAAAVCAVPSLWESFGYVAAAAAAHGRPVVASHIPALEDVVEDGRTGWLVQPDDPTALGEALAGVLASPERGQRMGLAGAKSIAMRCDPHLIASLTLDAYQAAMLHARWRGVGGRPRSPRSR